jgi:hypothetical protein
MQRRKDNLKTREAASRSGTGVPPVCFKLSAQMILNAQAGRPCHY